jgi:hypothetical protein
MMGDPPADVTLHTHLLYKAASPHPHAEQWHGSEHRALHSLQWFRCAGYGGFCYADQVQDRPSLTYAIR